MPVTASPPIYALLPSVLQILIEHPHVPTGVPFAAGVKSPAIISTRSTSSCATHYRRRTSPGA